MVKNSIKVYARLKQEDDRKKVVKYRIYRRADHEDISFPVNTATDATQKNRKYRFCKVFDPVSSQADIFGTVAKPILNSVINGFNGTIFAYGQTGSGKTYSITGSPSEYNQRGILPRSIEQIFEVIKTTPNLHNVYVSYLEIYNEIGYDLLNSKHQPSRLEDLPRVVLLEDANGEAHLRNLSVLPVTTEQEAMRLLFLGDTNRTIAETPMNEYSSRSHCIFTIYINSRNENGGKLRRSKLHLVDLAGSERICKANITGVTLREAKHINLSLHYLEQVILALSQSNRTHIPYRNSMMTYILRDSLSGNSLTTMLATLALTQQNYPETLTTCKFAQRVSCISTEAIINEEVDPQQEIEFLKAEVDTLRRQLAEAKGENTHKPLTHEDKERCKTTVDNFLLSNNELLPENLSKNELRCCLQYLKSTLMNKLNDREEKQRIEENVKIDLTTKYNAIIKEKDNEISVLTELLQVENHNDDDNSTVRVSSDPVCSTRTSYTDLKLATSERQLIDMYVTDKNHLDGVAQIKKSLAKKFELAKNVSKTVQKCQDNITDIREKLIREQSGTEISEKLHTFLISQQRIYKESLDQLENLKSETDFLQESLNQAEKKVIIKLKSAVQIKHKEEDTYNAEFDVIDNLAVREGHSYSHRSYDRTVKSTTDTDSYKKRMLRTNSSAYLNIPVRGKTCTDFGDFLPDTVERMPTSDGIYTPRFKTSGYHRPETSRFLLNVDVDSLDNFTDSTVSKNVNQKEPHHQEPKSLFKANDTPEFIEFMKTIPLTGDAEVDDEIFNFYRSKFEH